MLERSVSYQVLIWVNKYFVKLVGFALFVASPKDMPYYLKLKFLYSEMSLVLDC
jgi:hypothetical protein